jgi:hypothetical protein
LLVFLVVESFCLLALHFGYVAAAAEIVVFGRSSFPIRPTIRSPPITSRRFALLAVDPSRPHRPLLEIGEDVIVSQQQQQLALVLDFRPDVLAIKHGLAVQIECVETRSITNGDDGPLLGLFFGLFGNVKTAIRQFSDG